MNEWPSPQPETLDQQIDTLQIEIDTLEEQIDALSGGGETPEVAKRRQGLQTALATAMSKMESLCDEKDAEIDASSSAALSAAAAPHFTAEDFRQKNNGRTSGDLFSDRDPKGSLLNKDAA